ncbi:OmpA family protein [Thalassococcus sp. BH17M4-6]|uniref:OmpA family protein n=1 Tax=Thalassococcus sp. BH17M4-6 TaxID=3413148 RepID=UPI003BE29FAA
MLKYIRDSLPWIVPSSALVFAATGFFGETPFSRSAPEPEPAAAATVDRFAEITAAAQRAAAMPAPEPEMVARQSSFDENLSLDAAAMTAHAPEPAEVAAAAAPQPIPAARVPQKQAASAIAAQTALFQSSKQGAGSKAACVRDLEILTKGSRVYFPSGGVTAEQAGIEQAGVIAMIAENCPGVRIRVEGHSDPSGDPEANLRLSKLRAEQVINRVAASGLDTSMMFAEGLGDQSPSTVSGPEPSAYYDRRVEFALVEDAPELRTASVAPLKVNPWASETCVKNLERAAQNTSLFYAPRSVSLNASDLDIALSLAQQAVECPYARLRVVGHHTAEVQADETPSTGRLRAKALMAMLVGRGVPSNQIIIASPSAPFAQDQQAGMPGSRVNFDIILEDG